MLEGTKQQQTERTVGTSGAVCVLSFFVFCKFLCFVIFCVLSVFVFLCFVIFCVLSVFVFLCFVSFCVS